MLKIKLVGALFAALAVFAIPAGSALASTATFVTPAADAAISQNVTFTVDTTGDAGAAGVNFYLDNGSGVLGGTFLASGADQGSGLYGTQIDVGGWADGPVTIDADIVDTNGQSIETITENLTVANDVTGPSVTSTTPAADSAVSGTFTLSFAVSDQSGIGSARYSLDGSTYQALTSDGNGSYTATIDTVAQSVPNGDLYVYYRFQDTGGYSTEDSVRLVVENPVAPTIVPNTLVADKALYRTDETQLEVGDVVEAYGMQADGYPAPTITYVWNICRGQVCTGVTPGQDGDYTVQPADAGATMTLVATATNSQGTDSTSVDFGVIASAYVAPTPTPAPAPAPAPVDTPPAPAPSTPAPPTTTPVTPPVTSKPSTPTRKPARKKGPKPSKPSKPSTSKPKPATAAKPSTPAQKPARTKKPPKTGHPSLPRSATKPKPKPSTPAAPAQKPGRTKKPPKTGHPTLPPSATKPKPATPAAPLTPQQQAAQAAVNDARKALVKAQVTLQSDQIAVKRAEDDVVSAQGMVAKAQAEIDRKGAKATDAQRRTLSADKALVLRLQAVVATKKAAVAKQEQVVANAQKAFDDAQAALNKLKSP